MLFFEEVNYAKKIKKPTDQGIYSPMKKEQEIDHCEYMHFYVLWLILIICSL